MSLAWTYHLKGGPKRCNHAAVAVDDKIYSFGGYCGGLKFDVIRPMDVFIFDTKRLRWTKVKHDCRTDPGIVYGTEDLCCPFERYGHTAVEYKGLVYIWGGRTDDLADTSIFCFDPKTHRWTRQATTGDGPSPRDGHTASVVNGIMYVFGGCDHNSQFLTNELHMLDLKTFVWKRIETSGQIPQERDFHTATVVDKRIYVFGGRSLSPVNAFQEKYPGSLWFLDTEELSWHDLGMLPRQPIPKRSHTSYYKDGFIYVFGGYNSLCEEHLNEFHRYSVEENCWSSVMTVGTPPCRRRRLTSAVVGNRAFFFGGTSPGSFHIGPIRTPQSQSLQTISVPRLDDMDDLHILEYGATLKNLCLHTITSGNLELSEDLPRDLLDDMNTFVGDYQGEILLEEIKMEEIKHPYGNTIIKKETVYEKSNATQ